MVNIYFMKEAIRIASENVLTNAGGPFGAVVVKNGEIIGKGKNEVTNNNDPTAHAEIQAIREACTFLNNYQLTDCDIYTSCEPCPMCLGAIYWARPRNIYYASTKEEAAQIGFDDQIIYEQIALPVNKRMIKMEKLAIDKYNLPFTLWQKSRQKKEY